MQIVENWSDVTGHIAAIKPPGALQGHKVIELRVEAAATVEAFPNLLAEAVGQVVEVALPDAAVTGIDLAVGAGLRCRLRKATPQRHFAHPKHIAPLP